MGRIGPRIRRRWPWLWPFYFEARLLTHALRSGLWRSLAGWPRRGVHRQHVLTWPTSLPEQADAAAIVAALRHSGLRVHEGGNAFYLPPQPGLAPVLGPALEHYPPRSGFKVLRDFRGLDEAHYLHPSKQTLLRRRLIGTPRDQLVVANYLHRLGLGPRVWDVCLLRTGRLSMPAFVVQHVEGTAPEDGECAAFRDRLRAALARTELRISVPNWERNEDFRCPDCNGNLLRDASGALSYIDFQNFSLRRPRHLLAAARDHDPRGGLARAARRRTGERFRTVRDLLRGHGVELPGRLIVGAGGCACSLLHHALAAGGWWAIGWAEPAAARQAAIVAAAGGFSRLEILPTGRDVPPDLRVRIPHWLRRHLADAVVFVSAEPAALPCTLGDLPWRALVYEGRPGETARNARDEVRALASPGVRVEHETVTADERGGTPPLVTLVRQPAARRVLRPA